MSSNPLVGTWRLLSRENRTLGGEVSHPLGEDASGYIA
jgi:Lipocalin-like domain